MKLWCAADINRAVLPPSTPATFSFAYVDIGAVSGGTIRIPTRTITFGSAPARARRLAPAGATVVSTVRTYLRAIAAVPETVTPLVFSTGFAALEAKPGVDPTFLAYACQSEYFVDQVVARSSGIGYPAIGPHELADIDIPVPTLDEQRRIAKQLDGESEWIERGRALRIEQRGLVVERFDRLVDRLTSGDGAAGRIEDVCDILAGRTFPSSGFTDSDVGTRLLRGINVGVGALDWAEVVRWERDVSPRYRLDAGDLVVAMDRPWISGGARLAFVGPDDVPSLLVQRVARLRGRGGVDMRYVRWALHSSRFRRSVTLTGVSVPHLSIEQIASFRLHLPPLPVQRQRADALDAHAATTRELAAAIDAQVDTLAERRRALISELCR